MRYCQGKCDKDPETGLCWGCQSEDIIRINNLKVLTANADKAIIESMIKDGVIDVDFLQSVRGTNLPS